VKPNINSIEVHLQLSNKDHPMDGALVGAGTLWPHNLTLVFYRLYNLLFGRKKDLKKINLFPFWLRSAPP
jgi:hypothetical protein